MTRRHRFEEKSYEVAYCIEMAAGAGSARALFSPGQVLEKLLGFDASANPGRAHVLWQVLRLPRPPGVHLLPSWWSGGVRPPARALPTYPVSVFLQFKRPEYRYGPNALQYKLWNTPYYRFERTRHQHAVLLRLERNLQSQAVVRYAAPAFDTVAELEYAQLCGTIIQSSGHVGPSRLKGHKVWTYTKPGIDGIPNPNGQPVPFDSFASLLDDIAMLGGNAREIDLYRDDEVSVLTSHLRTVADACGNREPAIRQAIASWRQRLSTVEIEATTARALADFATIQSLVARSGGAWWVAG